MGPTGGYRVLQVHPSRRCNLRCRHCYSRSGPDAAETLDVALLTAALADAAALGYRVLSVSGGEPMLYRPLPDLLRAARAAGLLTTLVSNGMLLTERRLAALAGLVDGLAISLDGTPATHAAMRGDPRAFSTLERRLPAVRAAGIPFGFVVTLTQHNVHEVGWVAEFAERVGASTLQIHPLEPEGYAAENLAASVPDATELAFALLETARLRAESGLQVRLDAVRRADLRAHPDHFLAGDAPLPARLGEWLAPLVVEPDGRVVPLTYGMADRYALGSLHDAPLAELAAAWSPEPFRALCRATYARLVADGSDRMVSFYAALAAAA